MLKLFPALFLVLFMSACGGNGGATSVAQAEEIPTGESSIAELIVGNWSAQSFADDTRSIIPNPFRGETGEIEFFDDGTYSITTGTVAFVSGCSPTDCGDTTGVWASFDNQIIGLASSAEPEIFLKYVIPLNISSTKFTVQNELVISIMRKIVE